MFVVGAVHTFERFTFKVFLVIGVLVRYLLLLHFLLHLLELLELSDWLLKHEGGWVGWQRLRRHFF